MDGQCGALRIQDVNERYCVCSLLCAVVGGLALHLQGFEDASQAVAAVPCGSGEGSVPLLVCVNSVSFWKLGQTDVLKGTHAAVLCMARGPNDTQVLPEVRHRCCCEFLAQNWDVLIMYWWQLEGCQQCVQTFEVYRIALTTMVGHHMLIFGKKAAAAAAAAADQSLDCMWSQKNRLTSPWCCMCTSKVLFEHTS